MTNLMKKLELLVQTHGFRENFRPNDILKYKLLMFMKK